MVGKLVYDYLNSYLEEEKSRGRQKLWVIKQKPSLILARTEGWLAMFAVGWRSCFVRVRYGDTVALFLSWAVTVADWPLSDAVLRNGFHPTEHRGLAVSGRSVPPVMGCFLSLRG